MENEEELKQSKIDALRKLKGMNFYDQKTDNPENLPLEPKDDQTMQSDPTVLMDVLKRKKRDQELLNIPRE